MVRAILNALNLGLRALGRFAFIGMIASTSAVGGGNAGEGGGIAANAPIRNIEEARLLCPHIRVVGKLDPGLTSMEKRLVCGDPDGPPPWQTIPFPQAKFHLSTFLQHRGYLHPEFHPPIPPEMIAQVDVGEKTRVKRITIEGAGDDFPIYRRRGGVGEPLTPSLLEDLEKWVAGRLRSKGYACPQIKSEGNSETGEVILHVKTGPLQNLISVSQEPIPGVVDNILRRYDAFRLGHPLNADLLSVTENRISATGMVEATHFVARCESDGVHLNETVLAGPPRLVRFSFGLDTEGIVRGRASWRNTRLGQFASWVDFSGFGSSRLQRLETSMNGYFLPYVSRVYFNPLIQLNHRNEVPFEDLSGRTQFGLATTGDFDGVGVSGFLGPTVDFFKTFRGVGAADTRFVSLEGRVQVKSHMFEYYSSDPRAGFNFTAVTDLSHEDVFSGVTAQKIDLKGEALFNLMNLDPPLWIIGVRGGLTTVLTQEPNTVGTRLPASFLQYLGGSANLRGFDRQELPLNQVGGLTSGFLGFEFRLSGLLPFRIDPILFADFGAIGNRSAAFDSPLFWSPGFGVRWASPIGPIRTTLAQGYTDFDARQHWRFYFSFGEEF